MRASSAARGSSMYALAGIDPASRAEETLRCARPNARPSSPLAAAASSTSEIRHHALLIGHLLVISDAGELRGAWVFNVRARRNRSRFARRGDAPLRSPER